MSDVVVAAVIGGASGILIAAVSGVFSWLTYRRARRIEANTKATRVQVENDHDSNFREDFDSKHNENSKTLGKILREVSAIWSELHGLRDDDRLQRDRIHELEITRPTPSAAKKGKHS